MSWRTQRVRPREVFQPEVRDSGRDRLRPLHLIICQRISGSARESLVEHQPRPNPVRETLRNSMNEKPPKSVRVRTRTSGLSPPFHPFPSFFHQIQKHPRVGLRLCQTTGQIWSGYAAAWWSERSAWLLDGQATSSHIRTTTGPKFYNSWCKTW